MREEWSGSSLWWSVVWGRSIDSQRLSAHSSFPTLPPTLHPAAPRRGRQCGPAPRASRLTSTPLTHSQTHHRPTQCCRSTQSEHLFNDVMCLTSEGAQAKGKHVGVCVGRPVHRSMCVLADFDIKTFYVHLQFDYCQGMPYNRVQLNRFKLFLDTEEL